MLKLFLTLLCVHSSTISPNPPADMYSMFGEVVSPDTFPSDTADPPLPRPKMVTWGAICTIISALTFGGGKCKDKPTTDVLLAPLPADLEVAGAEEYKKRGFDTSKIK